MKNNLAISFLDFDDIKNPLLAAGQAHATMEIGKRLVAKGHNVTVYCANYPDAKDRTENGINYHHINFSTKNIRLNNIIYILSMPFVVPMIKADVILECFTAPVSTMLSPVWTKTPVVGLSTSFEAERFAKLYHFPFDRIERFGCRFYKYFISFTPSLVDKIKKFSPKIEARVIPYGIDPIYLKNPRKKPEHILFLGRIDMGQKGLDLLIKAYKKYEHEIDYPLFIGGHGPDSKNLTALIDSLGLTKKIKLIGSIYGEKKLDYLSKAVCVVTPSRQESFCLVALEAIASGLPVVAFAIPGLSWIQKGIAYKVKPYDIDLYGQTLAQVCREKDTKEMEKRNFAKQFTWDKVADDYEKFLQEIAMKGVQ